MSRILRMLRSLRDQEPDDHIHTCDTCGKAHRVDYSQVDVGEVVPCKEKGCPGAVFSTVIGGGPLGGRHVCCQQRPEAEDTPET